MKLTNKKIYNMLATIFAVMAISGFLFGYYLQRYPLLCEENIYWHNTIVTSCIYWFIGNQLYKNNRRSSLNAITTLIVLFCGLILMIDNIYLIEITTWKKLLLVALSILGAIFVAPYERLKDAKDLNIIDADEIINSREN